MAVEEMVKDQERSIKKWQFGFIEEALDLIKFNHIENKKYIKVYNCVTHAS